MKPTYGSQPKPLGKFASVKPKPRKRFTGPARLVAEELIRLGAG